MVAKKEIRDSRLTFTIKPEIEKRVREKVESEKRTLSGVIVSLLEKWLSDEPIHTDVTDMNQSLPLPPIVDIERMKAEILSEVMKEISTEREKKETLEPVQSPLIHTDMNQCESITEAPIPVEREESHIIIPVKEEPIPERYEAVNTGKPDQKEREKLSDDIKKFMIEFSPIITARKAETGEKNKRKIQKELFGFTDSEVSQMVKSDYSMTWKQYNKYMALMAEARKKYESVHTDMNTT
jgi:hypothetical protein